MVNHLIQNYTSSSNKGLFCNSNLAFHSIYMFIVLLYHRVKSLLLQYWKNVVLFPSWAAVEGVAQPVTLVTHLICQTQTAEAWYHLQFQFSIFVQKTGTVNIWFQQALFSMGTWLLFWACLIICEHLRLRIRLDH